MDRVCALGNKNHNPFKSLVQRLAYFLETNKLTVLSLLRRLGASESDPVSVSKFADFLKSKVEKRKEHGELVRYAKLIDVDKDGYIGEEDLKTCLSNIHSQAFFDNGGSALAASQFNSEQRFFPTTLAGHIGDAKVISVCSQIRAAMTRKKVSYIKLFKSCDPDGVGMANLGQFTRGVNSVVTVAPPLLEKLFNIMDVNKIGMTDYAKFERVLKC